MCPVCETLAAELETLKAAIIQSSGLFYVDGRLMDLNAVTDCAANVHRLSYNGILYRIKSGMTIDEALAEPGKRTGKAAKSATDDTR